MGEPNAEVSDQPPITHFSHPHQLQLLNLPSYAPKPPCAVCKLETSGSAYTCRSCNFSLHPKCYRLPQQINHPFHRSHALILHPKPVYPHERFSCDACGNHRERFCYHCSTCAISVHTICASLPLEVSHKFHHHQLSVTFSVPYPGNMFRCGLCNMLGSWTWVYRCNECGFDVHLTCVAEINPECSGAAPPPCFSVSEFPRQGTTAAAALIPPFRVSELLRQGPKLLPDGATIPPSFSVYGILSDCSSRRPTFKNAFLGNEEDVADELLVVRVKAPHTNVDEHDAKIHREAAVCIVCYAKFQDDNIFKTKCRCEFSLIHEVCATNWSVMNGERKCRTCDEKLEMVPVTLSKIDPSELREPRKRNFMKDLLISSTSCGR